MTPDPQNDDGPLIGARLNAAGQAEQLARSRPHSASEPPLDAPIASEAVSAEAASAMVESVNILQEHCLPSAESTGDTSATVAHSPTPSKDAAAAMAQPDASATLLPDAEASNSNFGQTTDASEPVRAAHRVRTPRQQIGRFRIVRMLGEGAFGTVYLAHDPQLDRQVALKIAKTALLPNAADRARFLREARAAAQLRHPHIIPVYEFGQIDHTCYIAYQFIPGRTLKSYMRMHGSLAARQAADIVSKLAKALHYAHTHGIIHRDMKPDNVIVDEQGEPHITDFGCARRESAAATQHTVQGTVLGTPAYMSPEQATGRSNQADGRSDVWSLGIMFMEMLTGSLPYKGTTTELLIHVQHLDAPRLRKIDPRQPKDLDTICQKCLARNPQQRFASAEQLADELDRWLRGEPIHSRSISHAARLYRWSQRNPVIARLLLTIFLLLLIGTTVSTALAIQAMQHARATAFAQVAALRTAKPESIPFLLQSLKPSASTVLPTLRRDLANPQSEMHGSRVRLALYALDRQSSPSRQRELAQQLIDDLLQSDPAELLVISRVLRPQAHVVRDQLWKLAQNDARSKAERFRAACALALLDAAATQWPKIAADVVGQLVVENLSVLPSWLEALWPVRGHLLPDLRQHFTSSDPSSIVAAAALARLYEEDGPLLMELVSQASDSQLPELLDTMRRHPPQVAQMLGRVQQPWPPASETFSLLASATEIANFEIVLLHAGSDGPLRARWASVTEPTVRTLEIHRIGHAGVDPHLLKQSLLAYSTARDLDAVAGGLEREQGLELAATLLALGQFSPGRLYVSEREALAPTLRQIASTCPDPAPRAAAEWLLKQWNLAASPPRSVPDAQTNLGHSWYTTATGTVMVAFDAATFTMGSDQPLSGGFDSLPEHQRYVPRSFAIAATEVTVRDFHHFEAHRLQALRQRFNAATAKGDTDAIAQADMQIQDLLRRKANRRSSHRLRDPVRDVTWFEAAAYCRWLGEQEGLAESEQCYPSVDVIEDLYARFMPLELPPQVLERSGYRLPTCGEWEYACRAGTRSLRPFGTFSSEYSGRYAWTLENSQHRVHGTAELMPNDAGLFDMLGNVCEWCHDWKLDLPEQPSHGPWIDGSDHRRGAAREVRGGSYRDLMSDIHSAARTALRPEQGDQTVGFRLARTWQNAAGGN